jgi:hypothetical protein
MAPSTRGWQEITRAAKREAKINRARVLSYPDLAKRLTEDPQRLAHPEQWGGYLPPVMWNEARNNSPVRAQLVDILAEALARANGHQTAPLETSLEPPPDDDYEPEEDML